jgi:GT2 family glycosyltransferase
LLNNIYIIIVTYNGEKWIRKCLQSTKPYPVIVVDNNSSDSTVNIINEEFPEIVLLKQKRNLGFGKANNIGIEYAISKGGQYVFLLNQDAYIFNDCINKLIEILDQNSNVGILSPIHLNGKGEKLDSNFSMFLSRCNVDKQIMEDSLLGREKSVYWLGFVNAAGWLVPVSVIKKVGLFDELFFHYGEDNNYCQRVKYFGYKIGVVPQAKIMHDRQGRINYNVKEFSEDYYIEFEKYVKIEFADLNLNYFSNKYKLKIKYHTNRLLVNIITLNLRIANDSIKKLKILKKLEPYIKKSRKKNLNYSKELKN